MRGVYDIFLGDMLRVYRLLSVQLRFRVWLLFLAMLASALLEVLSISALAFLGMSIASPETIIRHPLFARLFRLFPRLVDLYQDHMLFVLVVAIFVFLSFALKNIIQALVLWKVTRLSDVMSMELGEQILRRYLFSPYLWHISGDSGRTFTALSSRDALGNLIMQLLNINVYSISALALFITLLSATPGTILGAILITVILATLLYIMIKGRVDEAGKQALTSAQAQNKSLMNAINGIRDVLIYRQQPIFLDAYMRACRQGSVPRSFVAIAPPIPTWVLETIGIAVIPICIWLMAQKGNTDMGAVAAVISLVMLVAWRILPMVNRSLAALIAVRGLRPTALNALEVFEEMRRLPSMELPEPDPDFEFRSVLTLDDISFRYPDAAEDALRHVSLSIYKGEQVGFIGLSGAGKSTIVGILSGLMAPASGQICVDGAPMGERQRAAYMLRVGYVPQTPYIFAGTVADNVAFSQWGREYDRTRVLEACRMASLDIVERGDGIDTLIGERGAGLSGGQAQRVSIARALFCRPDILILDEATSSLDQANEDAIMETINNYRGKITVVLVAHRLTTLKQCSRLFWLETGRLVGQGIASELIITYKKHCASFPFQKGGMHNG